MSKEKGVNIGKNRVNWKLDCWLQMNVVIHKILSLQILGQIYHENWWNTNIPPTFICVLIFF